MSGNTYRLKLKDVVCKVLPVNVRRVVRHAMTDISMWKTKWHLACLRRRIWKAKPGSVVQCLNYTICVNDGHNFYILYKGIFVHRIYHFEVEYPDPLILDCGSNIGMSILYFKHLYPKARIIAFEPDPVIFPYLQENITRNGLKDVQLVQAALAAREGTMTFYSDGKYGSCLVEHVPADIPQGSTKYEVPCVRLRGYSCRI